MSDREAEESPAPARAITLTPFLTGLLQPSADYLGKELRAYIHDVVEGWKEKRRSSNLRGHIDAVHQRISNDPPLSHGKDVEQLEAFQEWVAGAQDVDPRDAEIASMWQELLCEIARGGRPRRLVLRVLSELDGADVKVLLAVRDHPRFRPSDGRATHHLRRLVELELVEERPHGWVLATPIVALMSMLLCARALDPQIFAGIDTVGDGLRFALENMVWIYLPLVVFAGCGILALRLLPKWRLSWLGADVTHYAPDARIK